MLFLSFSFLVASLPLFNYGCMQTHICVLVYVSVYYSLFWSLYCVPSHISGLQASVLHTGAWTHVVYSMTAIITKKINLYQSPLSSSDMVSENVTFFLFPFVCDGSSLLNQSSSSLTDHILIWL